MAKQKIPKTPEMKAAKRFRRRKRWARFFGIVLALVITVVIYSSASKDGNKIVPIFDPQPVIVQEVIQQVQAPTEPATVVQPTTQAPTQAPETTTAAPAPTQAPTTQPADNSSSGGGILDTITGLLGGFDLGSITDTLGGAGDALGGLVDRNGAADTIEGAGDKAKDFFYGLADNVEENQGLDGISEEISEKLDGLGGGDSGSGDSGSGGFDLSGLGGLGDLLGGLGGLIGG